MNMHRRSFLAMSASLVAVATTAALWPLRALAEWVRPQAAFEAKALDAVYASLGGTPEDSDQITFMSPEIAENGAVVPVSVSSKIAGTDQIAILVEMNPNPLAALFLIPEGTEPGVSTRVKVAQTCRLQALVHADGKWYRSSRETKVTLGGCGG
ncbi:MAG: thiosulfate oxidation carrier protein SoxY [Lysobacterales bacterium]|nr:thiosulfate oxidation carrier protein SoxY [Xanthomonadales bacterium]MCB1613625.1 thiosulfate oxidation carrier protein SoxY [Xanthomonadales bacterium]MCP5474236.1 thiosulfate oxidation carrier protein SoxY [Rhodanobacteraceae bacterium]